MASEARGEKPAVWPGQLCALAEPQPVVGPRVAQALRVGLSEPSVCTSLKPLEEHGVLFQTANRFYFCMVSYESK